jgi:hypothetical protein
MSTQSEFEVHTLSGLQAGCTLADITRCAPTSFRNHPLGSCEIRNLLYARVLLFKGPDEEEAVWINADECTFRRSITNEIKRVIEERLGIPSSCVMLTATHTHSAHGYIGFNSVEFGERVVDAIQFARRRLRPVRSVVEQIGTVPKKSIVNRRLNLGEKFGDICIMRHLPSDVSMKRGELDASRKVLEFIQAYGSTPEEEGLPANGHILRGPVDERLHLWTLLDENKQPIVGIARVNAHAVTVSQSRVGPVISADYIRPFGETIESSIDAPCLVFNGAFGNTRPLQKDYCFAECERIGKEWGQALLSAAKNNYEADEISWVDNSQVVLELRDDLPHEKEKLEKLSAQLKVDTPLKSAAERKKDLDKLEAISTLLAHHPPEGSGILFPNELEKGCLTSEWQAWSLGPVRLLCVPGEPFVELCREIEKESGCLAIGLSNGHLSYLPDGASFLRGGYEASKCTLSFDELNRLGALSGCLAEKI